MKDEEKWLWSMMCLNFYGVHARFEASIRGDVQEIKCETKHYFCHENTSERLMAVARVNNTAINQESKIQ